MLRFARCAAAVAMTLAASGCGGSSPFETVPVSGKVQLASGDSFANYAMCDLRFEPLGTAGEYRAAMGKIQGDGSFVLGTSAIDDGAIPGKYKVMPKLMKNYPPTPADLAAVWNCEPAEVEVSDDMEPLTLTITKSK